MVNFRFHVISLVAVFLALGIGILMGSTVIDQVTVKNQERILDRIKGQRDSQARRANTLDAELDKWNNFAEQGRDQLLLNRLADVPTLVVAVEGVDSDLTKEAHAWLRDAKARDQGTLRLSTKLALEGDTDAADLATAIGSTDRRADTVRRAAVTQLAAALTPPPGPQPATSPDGSPTGPQLLQNLRQGGFVEYDAPEGTTLDLAAVPVNGTRLIVVSGAGARVPDEQVAVPLVEQLAQREGSSVVAAQAAGTDPAKVESFVGPLRSDKQIAQRISTIDDLDRFYGQAALVLALEDMAGGAVGHYGIGRQAQRLLPAPNE